MCIEAAGEIEEIVVELMARPEPWVVGELTGMANKPQRKEFHYI